MTDPQSSERLDRMMMSQTELALIRTNMAMDRTILAVVRTGLALVGAGVAVQELLAFRYQEAVSLPLYAAGITMVVAGLVRHLKARRALRKFGDDEVLRLDRRYLSSKDD